jgi:hypothetical protein
VDFFFFFFYKCCIGKAFWLALTLWRSYLKPYCKGRRAAFFSVGI